MNTTTDVPTGWKAAATGLQRIPNLPIVVMTVGIFLVSAMFAGGSLSSGSLRTMLPLAAILAVAGIGQSLVVQQRGLDLSGAGVITLTAVVVSHETQGDGTKLPGALVLSLIIAAAVGLFNGLLVRFGLVSLVMTLATYQVLVGAARQWSNGVAATVPDNLTGFVNGTFLAIPIPVLLVMAITAVFTFVLRVTSVGRRFVESGINQRAALTSGSRINVHTIVAFTACSLCYWVAGVLAAGYVSTPSLNIGDAYLLAPIAVVVLGGNSFGSSKISVVATALGALFFQQLTQFTLSLGASAASQLYVQGAGIVALAVVRFGLVRLRKRRADSRISRELSASKRPKVDTPTGLSANVEA